MILDLIWSASGLPSIPDTFQRLPAQNCDRSAGKLHRNCQRWRPRHHQTLLSRGTRSEGPGCTLGLNLLGTWNGEPCRGNYTDDKLCPKYQHFWCSLNILVIKKKNQKYPNKQWRSINGPTSLKLIFGWKSCIFSMFQIMKTFIFCILVLVCGIF